MNLLVKRKEPTPSDVYDTFWRFSAERQRVFFSRLRGTPRPWTSDATLRKYKFTNAYRAADRVSQFLLKSVLYDQKRPAKEVFARCLLFKTFNRESTWKIISHFISDFPSPRSVTGIIDALDAARHHGDTIFSAAYIMPPGAGAFNDAIKHRNYIRLVAAMVAADLPSKIQAAKHLADVFRMLRDFPLMGNFLAFQYTIDLNYSEMVNFSEMDFVVPGPGARRGLKKCFSSFGDFEEPDVIRWTTDRQALEFQKRGLQFETLWGRPLHLIDIQNLYCEVDKYTRVAGPASGPDFAQKRPKQLFTANSQVIHYLFPPKWGLNLSRQYEMIAHH